MRKTQQPWLVLRLGELSLKLDRRVLPMMAALLLLGLLTLLLSISYGEYDITPLEVLGVLLGTEDDPNYRLVVWQFRLPRILVAFMIGAALAVSGAILQGITRNPLADPGLLGVSSGASLAAVAALLRFDVAPQWLPVVAFAGALGMSALVYTLAWKGGSSSLRLILVGIGFSAIASSLINMMLLFGEIQTVQQAYIWLAGSVYGRDWGHVRMITPWLLLFLPLAFLWARQLNTLNLGDEVAKGLGLRVEWQRGFLLLVSSALAAAAVAVAGTVGFVGLMVPHIVRRLVGPAHEGLLPGSALFGGVLVIFADLLSRMVIAPAELPLGVVTAMIGAPYFMVLLYRNRHH